MKEQLKAIREALLYGQEARKRSPLFGRALAALDAIEARLARPALTHEEIGRIAKELFPPDEINDGHPWYSSCQSTSDIACKENTPPTQTP